MTPRHCVICSRRFETTEWSNLPGLKCPRRNVGIHLPIELRHILEERITHQVGALFTNPPSLVLLRYPVTNQKKKEKIANFCYAQETQMHRCWDTGRWVKIWRKYERDATGMREKKEKEINVGTGYWKERKWGKCVWRRGRKEREVNDDKVDKKWEISKGILRGGI